MSVTFPTALARGFDHPVIDAGHVFRVALTATAHPGRVYACPVPPESTDGLNAVAYALALTLLDRETTVWLSPRCDTEETRRALAFHTGTVLVDGPFEAAFAFAHVDEGADLVARLDPGTDQYPDRSGTAILLVDALWPGRGARLRGPGIEDEVRLGVGTADAMLWPALRASNARFPLGVDVLLATDASLAAVPRTIDVEIVSCT